MKPKWEMTAVILAGGKSSRMGTNKALLKLGEKTVLENLIELFAPLFSEILVIVHDRTPYTGVDFGPAEVFEDLVKERGPLGGIYTALFYSAYETSCIFTCDMPFIDEQMIEQLVDFWEEDYDVICCESPDGSLQPFPGIYSRQSRALIGVFLNRREESVRGFLDLALVKPLVLGREQIRVFTNMNSLEDYYYVLREKNAP